MANSVASTSVGPSTFLGDESVYSQNIEAGYLKSDYLRNAYYYLSHRKSLLSLWQNLSYQDSAFDETVPTDTIPSMDLVSPMGDTNMREREYAQWDLAGNVVTNLGQLYEHAEFVKPVFESSLKHIASECNLTVREPQDGRETTAESGLLLCTPKMADRATEKAREEYSKVDPGPPCSWVYDILRASFVCDTEEQIRNVYDLIGFDSNFTVIRVKNRFKTPTTAGFRDILINVMLEDIGPTGKPTHFICEIQITHIDLRQYEIENDTISLYTFFRSLTSGSQESQDAKVKLLEKVVSTTSPILNAVGVSADTIDGDITEAIGNLCKEVLEGDKLDDMEDWIDVLEAVSEYELAEKIQRRLIKLEMKRFGEQNQMVSDSLLKLGGLLKAQNELDQAADVYQAAVVMKNELLGEYDAQVADALFCMAEVRTMQHKYEAAVPLHEQVLLIRRKLYFRDNPDIAVSLIKLAEIMEAQENQTEAISYYRQALAVWQAVYGENSPFVAACMNSLALLLDNHGISNEAKSMFERCVSICKILYGEDHTSVASAMNNLALCLKKLGEYEEAYALYEQALVIRRARYGEKHPAVATTLNNLGLLLKQQQRYEEAKQLYLQALQIRREVLGANHVDVASSLSNLALLHEAMGNLGEALFLHENTRTMRVSILGPEHPTVAATLVNMGLVHKKMKNYEDARVMFEKAIEIYGLFPVQTSSGTGPHPEIANIKGYLKNLDDLIEAGDLQDESENSVKSTSEKSISSKSNAGSIRNPLISGASGVPTPKVKVRVYRSEHEKLAASLRTMALSLQERSEIEAAQPFFEQSLGLLLAVTGGKPDGSEACAEGIVLLALLYRELGRHKLCYDLLQKAMEEFYAIYQGRNNIPCISTMREMGKTLNMQRQFAASSKILSEALIVAETLEDSIEERSKIITEIGINDRDTNDLDAAKLKFEEVLQMRVTAFGETNHLVGAALIELGQLYRLKANFTAAREYYEDALKIFVDVSDIENGKCNKDVALTHRRIGLAYKEENMWVLAFASLQKSIDLYSSPKCGLSAESLELASTLYEAAHVTIRLSVSDGGGLDNAVSMLSRALEIREKRLGRFHQDTAQTKLDLAVKLRMNSRNLSILAKNAFTRSVNFGGNKFGEEFVQLSVSNTDATYESSLAIVLLENAAEAFEQANMQSMASGNRDTYNLRELANVYLELGGILVEEQMWSTAAPVYDKLLETYQKIYGRSKSNSNDRTIVGDATVMSFVESKSDLDSSHNVVVSAATETQFNPLLSASESVAESDIGNSGRHISRVFSPDLCADSDEIATALASAAFVFMRCNKLKRAKDMFLEAIEILSRLDQGSSLAMAEMYSNFAELREREKKSNKAKELHDSAYNIRLKLLGDEHPLVADSIEELGHLRAAANKFPKAESLYMQAVKIRRAYCAKLRRHGGSASSSVASFGGTASEKRLYSQATLATELAEADNRLSYNLVDLAVIYRKQSDTEKAKELLEEAIEIERGISIGFHPILFSGILVELSNVYISVQMYEEAKVNLLEALQIREEHLGTEHRLVVEVLHLLAHALDCLQEISDAQRVLEQALGIYIRLNHSEYNEDVANTYAELGKLFFHRAEYGISITYFKKALEVWMKLKGIESTEVTDAMLNLAFAFKKNNEVFESRNTYEQAAAILRRRHGYNHPDVASVLASLSSLSFYEGKFEESLDYSKQVLQIRKRLYGRDNEEVVNTTANQAIIYEKLLMNKNAHKLCLRVLAWREEKLSPDDPLVANALIAVSDSFRRLGNIPKAFEINIQAIEHLRTYLGEEHVATIQRVAVSGELYRVQGRYLDAEKQLRYAADTALVGSNNEFQPFIISIVLELAGVTRILGKYMESERWYRSVLSAQEDLYGHDSSDVAKTLCCLGVLCMDQFKLKEASDYLDESLTTRVNLFGERHPDVASSLNNLGSLMDLLGRHEEAKLKFEQALQIRVEIYGAKHPSVAQSINNIANMFSSIGKFDEAESLFLLSQSIISRLFGEDHPDYSVAVSNMASLLDGRNEHERSKFLHQKAFAIRKDVFGDNHPACAVSMNNIGSNFVVQNKLSDAAKLFQEAINIRRRAYGGDHNVPVAEGFNNQASVYMAEGRYQIAAKLQRQASQIMEDILGYHHPVTVNIKGNLGISCRRNGEINTGNTLLREASEYLVNNNYPDYHPWVRKFNKEAGANGTFGTKPSGSGDSFGVRSPGGTPMSPSAQSPRSLMSQDSTGASAIRPALLTGQDAANMKDVTKRTPARMQIERFDNDVDSVQSIEDSILQYSGGESSFQISTGESFQGISQSFAFNSDDYSRSFIDDESTVGGQSKSFQEIAETSEVRVVVGKKREPDFDAALPILPKLLPKAEDTKSDDSDRQRHSFGDGMDTVVSRVVTRKGPQRGDPGTIIVPKGLLTKSESGGSDNDQSIRSESALGSDSEDMVGRSRHLGSMISMDVIDLDDLKKPHGETPREFDDLTPSEPDEETVISNEPGATYSPFAGGAKK